MSVIVDTATGFFISNKERAERKLADATAKHAAGLALTETLKAEAEAAGVQAARDDNTDALDAKLAAIVRQELLNRGYEHLVRDAQHDFDVAVNTEAVREREKFRRERAGIARAEEKFLKKANDAVAGLDRALSDFTLHWDTIVAVCAKPRQSYPALGDRYLGDSALADIVASALARVDPNGSLPLHGSNPISEYQPRTRTLSIQDQFNGLGKEGERVTYPGRAAEPCVKGFENYVGQYLEALRAHLGLNDETPDANGADDEPIPDAAA